MGRSQKWPDLRSPISKIQDIRFVGTDDLIIFRKFHNFPWNIVAVARWESYFVVGSLDLTWWPDLTWPWAEIFTKVAEKIGGKVGENPAALRVAVFFAILEKPEGGGGRSNAPPSRARVNGVNVRVMSRRDSGRVQGMACVHTTDLIRYHTPILLPAFSVMVSHCKTLQRGVTM